MTAMLMNARRPRVPTRPKFSPEMVLLPIILLAAALRILGLGNKTFSADEGIAWWMALGKIEHDAPAVYQWAFGWAIHLFGWSEFVGRLPSALFGLLSILVLYAIGKNAFDSRFGLLAAFFAAVSAYLVPLSQELRIYSLLGMEILLTLWIFLRILNEPQVRWGWWVALLAVGLAGQYTHCFFIFVLGYFGLALIAFGRAGRQKVAIIYFVMGLAVAILSLPTLWNTFSVATGRPHVYAADFQHLKMNSWRLLRSCFGFLFGDFFTNRPGSIRPFLASHPLHIVTALLMTGTWTAVSFSGLKTALILSRGQDFRAQVVRVLLGMLIVFTLLFVLVDVSTSGHLIFIFIPFFLLVSTSWISARRPIKTVLMAFLLFTTGISLAGYYRLPYFAYERADWRSAGTILERKFKPDDALLILQARNAYYTVKFYDRNISGRIYYRPRHDSAAVKDREVMDWWNTTSPQEKVDSLLSMYNRVWVLESIVKWQPQIRSDNQLCQTWDLGYDLQLYLIESRLERPRTQIRD